MMVINIGNDSRMETPNAENIKNKFIFTMDDARVVIADISIHITMRT